ncbi:MULTISPECIES: hypothetical protein [Erwinia]|uniref:hypothetical protein n=1 Tax=Erwinia TaxID=551 RepID=UPI0010613E74|nr:hypothetical protein [Erwinia aphidicola]MCP2234069.1 hypothetical protein [Erwinia aphidicola]
MCITVTEKDLRELQICRAARIIEFRRACRLRARAPEAITLDKLTTLRSLIDDAEEEIAEFTQNFMS